MMGTNDNRHNKDGMRATKNSQNNRGNNKQKPQTNIKILEIPPFRNHNHQKERNLFNLAMNKEDPTTTATAKEMMSLPLDNILKEDGYHITPKAGKIIANSINKDPKQKNLGKTTRRKKPKENKHQNKTSNLPPQPKQSPNQSPPSQHRQSDSLCANKANQ